MLKTLNKGFTIIELLIVIVVIGLLAVLVLSNVGGATDAARDVQRKDDIAKMSSQLELYQATNSYYPSEANMEDEGVGGWVDTNLDIDIGAALDPSDIEVNAVGGYQYTATPANCDNGANGDCTGFTLSADLEEDERGTADTDSDLADFVKSSVLN